MDIDKAEIDKTGTDNKGTEASQTGSQETADPGNASRSSPQTVTEAPAQVTLQAPAAADQTQTPQQPAPVMAEPKEETASEPAPQAEESKPETQAATGSHVSVNGMMAAITGSDNGMPPMSCSRSTCRNKETSPARHCTSTDMSSSRTACT